MSPSVRALARFWWLVIAGLVVGGATAVVVYSLESGKKHTATAQLLVNSPNEPLLRSTTEQVNPGKAVRVRTGATGASGAGVSTSEATIAPPDTQTLVTAANVYPFLIESQQIANYRQSLYGPARGTLTAVAHNASTNSYGVYHPSPLPIIDVSAKAKMGANASSLVQETIDAFSRWVSAQQRAKSIPVVERLQIQQLTAPAVTATGGPKLGLPIFIGFLVFLAFCGLALLLGQAGDPRGAGTVTPRSAGTPASPHPDR